MKHVFVSYAQQDVKVAGRLRDALRLSLGCSVLWDKDLRGGDDWEKKLDAATRKATCVVALWSHSSVSSKWVLYEAAVAKTTGFLIPVQIDECEIPEPFQSIQAIDLSQWNETEEDIQFQKLVGAARGRLARARAVRIGTVAAPMLALAMSILLTPGNIGWGCSATSSALAAKRVALILNEDVPHIRRVSAGFQSELAELMKVHVRIAPRFGNANNTPEGDEDNAKAFASAFEELGGHPDVVVTVGSQVSVYAAKHYAEFPRYFIAVSDPVSSALIRSDELGERAQNVSGYGNGINKATMVAQFSECFPGRKFLYVWGPNQTQDVQTRTFLQSEQSKIQVVDAPMTVGDASTTIDRTLLLGDPIVFGWNLLNTNINRFVSDNPKTRFIGPALENIGVEVIACYGSDFNFLGKQAAKTLVNEYFRKGSASLGSVPVELPDLGKLYVSERLKNNLQVEVPQNCGATFVP